MNKINAQIELQNNNIISSVGVCIRGFLFLSLTTSINTIRREQLLLFTIERPARGE